MRKRKEKKMAIIEVSFKIACPDGMSDKVIDVVKGDGVADSIARQISGAVDSDMIAVEVCPIQGKRLV